MGALIPHAVEFKEEAALVVAGNALAVAGKVAPAS
jgi:hypothetical protein